MVIAMERTTPPSRLRAVPKLPDAERDRQADFLKYYLHDQRSRASTLLEEMDALAGAWPSNTGLDPDMIEVVRQLKAEGRHVAPTIRRVDAEPPSVLGMLGLVSPYPRSHWKGWRQALMSLKARQNTVIAMTVLDYYPDDFVARSLGLRGDPKNDQTLITEARREGLRAMVVWLHERRLPTL